MPAQDDNEIRALVDGKYFREAFQMLITSYGDRLLRLAYSIVGDRTAADDVLQDVFLRIWRALPSYRGDAALSTWAYAITRNTSLTALTKAKRRTMLSLSVPGVQAQAERQGENPRWNERADLLARVEALPDPLRQATVLFYLEGKSYEQVASSLGVSLGTVKVRLHRARKSLLESVMKERA